MSAGFTLDIADLAIAVTADDDLPIAAEGSARKFVRAGGGPSPSVRVHARWGEPAVSAGATLVFDSGKGLWRLYRAADRFEIVFTSPALGAAPYQVASFSEDWREGRVTLRRGPFEARLPIYPLHYPLDEVFMVHLLAQGLGVEIHGAGVVTADGRGFLFAGQSGAGKTTLSRLWQREPGVTVLSDERVILRGHADGVWMYGTPWHGDGHIATPGRARLERIFLIRHGAANELHDLPATAALMQLFACGFTPFHDASGLDYSLRLLGDVVRACRCAELHVVPDRAVIDFVLAA
ncbi:MAG TPA: hypothetical protein VLA14_10235 [Polyangia bacterium]|jgi:hypothetical protein|nr:hypothetical protein [Polyangia bacterium]